MYLNIHIENIDKHRKEAREEAVAAYGDDEDSKGEILFSDVESEINEFQISDNRITFNATVKNKGDKILYLDYEIPLDMDEIATLISEYVKKANKIKTLLEASK